MGRTVVMVYDHNYLLILASVFIVVTSFGDLIPPATGINYEDIGERRKLAVNENQGYMISIDCGAEGDYLDNATGILFKSDKEFISTGENHATLPQYDFNNTQFGQRFKTLRSFPNGPKNCYTTLIPPPPSNSNSNNSSGGGGGYRIRASFSYGNYDGRNTVPKFDLYLGVNYWTTVQFDPGEDRKYYEIIVNNNNNNNVDHDEAPTTYAYAYDLCLVNTGSGVPFISAIEIRPSNTSVYGAGQGVALLAWGILDYGSDVGKQFGVRYKDDEYDRVWFPNQLEGYDPINTSLPINTQGSDNVCKIPAEVLATAIQANGSNALTHSIPFTPGYQYNVYFHFAEFVNVSQGLRRRQFNITLNGVNRGPFTLKYLEPFSVSFPKFPAEEDIQFTIAPTLDSDLPPILNAFELYRLQQFQDSPTNLSDVEAIMSIKNTYNINRDDWQGDPCLPKNYSWSGLNCSTSTLNPRIISLNLSSSKLTGEISPSLADLLAIESVDLSNNELNGSVPEFFAQLPNLKVLNLSGNKLTGPIPQSLKDKSDNGTLLLSFNETPQSCERDQCKKKKFNVPLVASTVSASALLVLLTALIIFCRIRRRKQREFYSTATGDERSLKSRNRPFTYSEIVRITSNFKTEIGEGGFGKVFLGHLNDNTPVAVKLLSSSSKQGYKEFQAEAQLLMIVHHKNLVSLIGYCKEDNNMALVYEYMSQGNLRQHLSDTNRHVLDWKQRLQIATDAAQGLEYLHNGCRPPIVHRDLKPANILLAESMQAKIADFGLSRVFSTDASHISTCPAGTLGYLDPEFHASGNLSKKSDVYSFGVILLEIVTGQPVIIRNTEENIHLQQWVSHIIRSGDIREIVDPKLHEFNVAAAWKVVEVAMLCLLPTSIQRPDMSHVLAELKECLALEMPVEGLERVPTAITFSSNSLEMDNTDLAPIAR